MYLLFLSGYFDQKTHLQTSITTVDKQITGTEKNKISLNRTQTNTKQNETTNESIKNKGIEEQSNHLTCDKLEILQKTSLWPSTEKISPKQKLSNNKEDNFGQFNEIDEEENSLTESLKTKDTNCAQSSPLISQEQNKMSDTSQIQNNHKYTPEHPQIPTHI